MAKPWCGPAADAKDRHNAIADGFQIYLTQFFSPRGRVGLVQQGMNQRADWRAATTAFGGGSRFHFAAIRDCREHQGTIMNLVTKQAEGRNGMLAMVREPPDARLGAAEAVAPAAPRRAGRGRGPERAVRCYGRLRGEFRDFVRCCCGKTRPAHAESLR